MTTLSSDGISNDFMNNALCPGISSLSDENHDMVTDGDVTSDLGDTLKNTDDVSMMQIQVSLPTNSGIGPVDDKRLSSIYITFPMGSVVKYSMNYMCRLCSEVIDANSAINIFSADQFQENIAYKINKYLPIVVYESDPFPKTVCKLCVSKINQFHDLVEKCVTVEEQLRQTYVFDGRYLDELNKKLNQKPCPESLKQDPENSDQLYSLNEFHCMDNLDINQLSSNSNKQINEENNDLCNSTKSENCDEKKSEDMNDFGKDEKTLTCQYCEAHVMDLKDCLKHWDHHYNGSAISELPCLFCDHSDSSKAGLEHHIEVHFMLSQTSKNNTNIDKTKARQQKYHKSKMKVCTKILCCRKCKESLDTVDVAIEHCLKHKPQNVKIYPCVLCMNGISKSKLKEHISMHYPSTTKPVLTCDICNNLYPDEKTLKYHRCTKLRKYKCSQCKQGFKSEDRLKFHEDFHRNKSTFCDICKKDFKFESRIYLHFAGVHNGIREKPYCCDVCGKTFTWLTILNSHKRTHTNERPFKCTKCDATFCNKYSLNGHMPSHEDHPQMYCDKCDYHTGRKQNLQNHVSRFHKEISSSQTCIQCRICNEIFPNRHHADVEGHPSKHSDTASISSDDLLEEVVVTKLYQCERCERCFTSVDHLTQHRTSHVSSDLNSFYQCRLCDSSFSKHDLLVKHQKVHVRITSQYTSKLSVLIVISCDICGMECVDYRQLLNHKDRANCMMKKITGTLRPRKVLIKKHLQPLKTHQLYINSNGLFECPSCQRTYKNRRRYRLHLATHSNTVPKI